MKLRKDVLEIHQSCISSAASREGQASAESAEVGRRDLDQQGCQEKFFCYAFLSEAKISFETKKELES